MKEAQEARVGSVSAQEMFARYRRVRDGIVWYGLAVVVLATFVHLAHRAGDQVRQSRQVMVERLSAAVDACEASRGAVRQPQ